MNLLASFLIAAFISLFQNIFFSSFQLQAFAPFFALLILQSSIEKSLWGGIFAGLFMDLLSTSPMGFFTFIYFFVICAIFFMKKYFDINKVHHLVFATILISMVLTVFYAVGFFLFDRISFFTGKWVLVDLLILSVVDGLYGLLVFYVPVRILQNFHINVKKLLLKR